MCIIDPDVPGQVIGDPGRLRQVILNLGGNAIKFTHQGGVTLRASLVLGEDESSTVRIAITDTGIGIAAEKQAKLFTPFTQVDGSITRKFGGTGLGLAISKQLAELMGGTIGVESPATSPITQQKAGAPRSGSRFSWARGDGSRAGSRSVLQCSKVSASSSSMTVRRIVFSSGPSCTTGGAVPERSRTGRGRSRNSSVQRTMGDPYRFALMDLVMPGIDGAEVGRRIKASPVLRNTHLIMMTSLGEQGDRERVLKLGFAAYFTKPFRQNQLKEAMQAILAGRSAVVSDDGAGGSVARQRNAVSRPRMCGSWSRRIIRSISSWHSRSLRNLDIGPILWRMAAKHLTPWPPFRTTLS